MKSVITSLANISKEYTVFTKDQVLTEQQLNSVTNYLDDQQRLSRTALSGVGIVQGLNISASNSHIRLSPGLGVTRDGDLFTNYQALVFDRIKSYPEDGPQYEPFMLNGQMLPFYQLVAVGESDTLAKPINVIAQDPNDWLFVLFAQSVVEDKDICTGTSCDNGSRTYYGHMRLMAISREYAEYLSTIEELKPPAEQEMLRLYTPNIKIDRSLDTQQEWFKTIRTSCEISAKNLLAAFKSFWPNYSPYLSAYVQGNPTANWSSKLSAIANKAKTENGRLQYYYECLNDINTTWNNLLNELEKVTPSMLIGVGRNSKHLLLGALKGEGPRDTFTPSPVLANQAMEPVLFYLEKLSALLSGFVWTGISSIKVTPTSHSLPSVPGFYNESVFNVWDYASKQANKQRYLLGYHADKNKPLGGADNPLNRRQNSFDGYRVEGVLGKNYTATLSTLQNYIQQHQLPFSVSGALIEGTFQQVIGPFYRPRKELDNLQYLFRKDLVYQLEDVTRFSGSFKNEIVNKAQKEALDDGDSNDLGYQVEMRDIEIRNKASEAISLLNKPFLSAQEKVNYKSSINAVVKNAGLFKNDVSKISTTHFPTMFDQIIVNQTPRWVDWLDVLAQDSDKKDKEAALLPNFLKQNPGFEVGNEVVRGGTFILLYNSDGTVVGSGMLSHYIAPVFEETETSKPELPKFDFPLAEIPLPGIKVIPSLEFEFTRKFADFSVNLNEQFDKKIEFSSVYGDAFKDSLNIVRDIYVADAVAVGPRVDGASFDDLIADKYLEGLKVRESQVDALDVAIKRASTGQEKQIYQKEKEKVQQQMAEEMVFLVNYVGNDDSLASKGGQKMAASLSNTGQKLAGNTQAIGVLENALSGTQTKPILQQMKGIWGPSLGF